VVVASFTACAETLAKGILYEHCRNGELIRVLRLPMDKFIVTFHRALDRPNGLSLHR